ncbi:MAG: thioredoxin family protein [Piscinibacter sp.]
MLLRRFVVALLLGAVALTAQAIGFPQRYSPTQIQPSGAPQRLEFDLTAALQRAQRENRRIYLYLGAVDCPFCRKYEAFLDKNAAELAPHFAKEWIVFEMRSSLAIQADRLWFRIGDKTWSYADFMRHLGDERARQLVYPSVWLLDPAGKPLMQMPAGTGTFETVPEQLEILRLEQ